MTKTFRNTVFVAGVGFGALTLAPLAAAAPPPTPMSGVEKAQQPSPTPADPGPPTGGGKTGAEVEKSSEPERTGSDVGQLPGGETRTTPPPSPGGTAGILNDKDIPGQPAALSPKETRAAQKAVNDLHKVNALEIALGALARERAMSDQVKEYARDLVGEHQAADRKLADYAASHGLTLGNGTPPAAQREDPPTAGTGTGDPGPGTVAGTVSAPSTTGTTPPPSTATGAAAAAPEHHPGVAGQANVNDASSPSELDAEGRRILSRLQRLDGENFDRQFLITMVRGHTKALSAIKGFERQQKNSDMAGLLSANRTMVEHHLERARELQRGSSSQLDAPPSTLGTLP